MPRKPARDPGPTLLDVLEEIEHPAPALCPLWHDTSVSGGGWTLQGTQWVHGDPNCRLPRS